MATANEPAPEARQMNILKREPKPSNRMAGDTPDKVGDRAFNYALGFVVVAWLIVFLLPLSLRDYLK